MALIKAKEPWRAGEAGGSPCVVEWVTRIRVGETDELHAYLGPILLCNRCLVQ
jgi:hypothetical protein